MDFHPEKLQNSQERVKEESGSVKREEGRQEMIV